MKRAGALERLFGTLESVAAGWQAESLRRRAYAPHDPLAEVLEHCASELADQVRDLKNGTADLSVEDVARLNRCTPQTVRNWIRRGELEATDTADGWRIPLAARRRKAS